MQQYGTALQVPQRFNLMRRTFGLEHLKHFAEKRVVLAEFLTLLRADVWKVLVSNCVLQDASSVFATVIAASGSYWRAGLNC